MGDILFLIAYLVLPVIAYLWVRSLTWLAVWFFAASALVGSAIDFTIDQGMTWNYTSLQLVTLVTFLLVAVAAFFSRRHRGNRSSKAQFMAIGVPIIASMFFVVFSRLLAVGRAGPWEAVGFFVQRIYAEDNAKWLDFSGQLMAGIPIEQAVPLGGPLQIAVVISATFFSAVSFLAFGGVNEVFVASNSILFLQFGLAALTPLVLAPFAETRLKDARGAIRIPAPALWVGALALMAGSLAVSGLGHLTFQYAMLVVGLWFAVFLADTHVAHARLLTSVATAVLLIVWFPLLPVSIVIYLALVVYFIRALMKKIPLASLLLPISLSLVTLLFIWQSLSSTLIYVFGLDVVASVGISSLAGGGVRAAAGLVEREVPTMVPALEVLDSQGGTEQASPVLLLLAALVTILALKFQYRLSASARATAFAFAPISIVIAYAFVLQVLGTWYSGSGPNYGAMKMTFFAIILVITVCTPFAVMEVDQARRNGRFPEITPTRIGAVAAIAFLLAADGLLTRAVTYVSPDQWPSVERNRNYWWPAEVRPTADQPISASPIGCVYLEPGELIPTVLRDGQRMYACTRILAGLSGMDSTAQPLVDYQRREWLTNESAWLNEYPGLQSLPPETRAKKLILISGNNDVVGLESIAVLMQRYKPEWAK